MKRFLMPAVLVAVLLGATSVSAAATWTVGRGGDFKKIQDAIDSKKVKSGDTLMVLAGKFDGARVTKRLNIIGQGTKTVISNGPRFSADNSQKIGFVFEGRAGKGSKIEDMMFRVHLPIYAQRTDDITVSGLLLEEPVQGITNWGGSGWIITGNKIVGLRVKRIGTARQPVGGIGILVGDRFRRDVEDNRIIGNTLQGKLTVPDGSLGGVSACFITLYADFRDNYQGAKIIKNNVIGGDLPAAWNTIINFNNEKYKKLDMFGISIIEVPKRSDHVITENTAKNNVLHGGKHVETHTNWYPPALKNENPDVQSKLLKETDIPDAAFGEDEPIYEGEPVNPL